MILHKASMLGSLTHRDHYRKYINELFNKNFEGLDKYKKEKNFKEILAQLSLDDVCTAIRNAKKIRSKCEADFELAKSNGYTYYKENPSCSIDEHIKEIMVVCGLYQKESKKKK